MTLHYIANPIVPMTYPISLKDHKDFYLTRFKED